MSKNYIITILCFAGLLCGVSCKKVDEEQFDKQTKTDLLDTRYNRFLQYPLDSLAFPRSASLNSQKIKKVSSSDWTSGFFAGNFWQMYQLTGDENFKNKAKKWTAFIEKEKFNDHTHDMGFKVYCSFGKGLEVEENEDYRHVIVKSAQTLSTRFNKNMEVIRSWDFNKDKWQFPVIIDNMMNLELLFEATKISGDSSFHKLAVKHANTTLKNHFRSDNSTWHVIDYDTINYQPRLKITHQGYNDDSSWARGQAWAIYGFTMAYRYTKDSNYLEQAIATASFYLNHKNLPKDGIPYWDFNDPTIPNAPRDVSAGAIVASAFVELYSYTKNEIYLDYSKKLVSSLTSVDYILKDSIKAPFILDHSTGNWPKKDEVDEPIVYGDYYFLETLIRLKN
ncbi:glycoside hydrolase family 88 protein [uncultured Winogradskyella sp.]|uniref:glycoside hydrolase family 88 protein n=1 Tax=uncultured Winogradskyella sp. TaxID=395353 RepID=UPI0026205499|nr:glycoside hydrolase family 88 protein [uncultured Winogradskyella sp.]